MPRWFSFLVRALWVSQSSPASYGQARNLDLLMLSCLLPQEGHQQGPKAEISQLAWNPKIPHILATCTTAGTVTVWDLKKQATVLNLSDNQG